MTLVASFIETCGPRLVPGYADRWNSLEANGIRHAVKYPPRRGDIAACGQKVRTFSEDIFDPLHENACPLCARELAR